MMADNPKISIEVSATGADRAKSQIEAVGKAGNTASGQVNGFALAMKELVKNSQRTVEELKKANVSIDNFGKKMNTTKKEVSGLSGAFNGLKTAVAGYLSLQAGKQLIGMADEYRQLQNNIRLVTKDQDEYNKSLKVVTDTSQKAGLKLNQSAGIFSRFAIELSKMGKNNEETNKFFQATVKLGSVGSSNVASMSAALTQLGQSLGGVVQADEFRSIREQAPLIANALLEYYGKIKNGANGAAISQGELQQKFKDGAVKSIDLYNAIIAKSQLAEDVFNRLPVSVERSFIGLQNSFTKTFVDLDNTIGLSQGLSIALQNLAKTVDFLGKNTDVLQKVLVTLGAVIPLVAIASFRAGLTALLAVFPALRTACIALAGAINPLGVALTVVGTVAIAVFANGMIDGFNKTREAVKKQTGGMISDLDILNAHMAGMSAKANAWWKAQSENFSKHFKTDFNKATTTLDFQGFFNQSTKNAEGNIEQRAYDKAYKDSLIKSGKASAEALKSQGLGLGTAQSPFMGTGKDGKSKKSSAETEAEKEAKKYASAVSDLKKKLAESNVEMNNANLLLKAFNDGGVAGYQIQMSKNQSLTEFNSLMGEYLGKGKKELEELAKKIVANKKIEESNKNLAEFYSRYKTSINETNALLADEVALKEALAKGGIKAYEAKQKELEITKKIREEDNAQKAKRLGGLNKDQQQKIIDAEKAKQDLDKFSKANEATAQRLKNQYQEMGNAIKTAFDNTIEHMVNGTSSFKEIFVGLMRQLAVNALRALVSSGLQAFFAKFNGQTGFLGGLSGILGKVAPSMTGGANPTGSFGGGIFGTAGTAIKGLTAINAGTGGLGASSAGGSLSGLASIASKIGGFFGGFKATGGDMQGGKSYVVGERGAEIFKPATSGTMIPNHAIGGGSTVVSNVNITMNGDGSSSSEQLKQSAQAISDMVTRKVYDILNTEKRQGGMFNRTGSFA